jgi:hypothetical protein
MRGRVGNGVVAGRAKLACAALLASCCACAGAPAGAWGLAAPIGVTYYVSPAGSDSNSGQSAAAPWRTVGKVNAAALRAGDSVLFQGGATFADSDLEPGHSGAAEAPIVYGSYGAGAATLSQGVWLCGVSWISLQNLAIVGASQGILGSAGCSGVSHLTIDGVTIRNVGIAINSANYADTDWTIQSSTVDQTGDSGLILLGDRMTVSGDTITNTGTDASILYGKHGIYLKASNSLVTGNTIRGFLDDGVSARYRDSVVERNTIADGAIGIAWFQNDPTAGASSWSDNVISGTTAAGIYVSASDSAGATRESFVIAGNRLSKRSGRYFDLRPTSGTYVVADNTFQ